MEINILQKIIEEWNLYKQTLMEKYPVSDVEEWEFTCEHHKKIDELLKEAADIEERLKRTRIL